MRWGDVLAEGTQEALISDELWSKVQDKLAARTNGDRRLDARPLLERSSGPRTCSVRQRLAGFSGGKPDTWIGLLRGMAVEPLEGGLLNEEETSYLLTRREPQQVARTRSLMPPTRVPESINVRKFPCPHFLAPPCGRPFPARQ